MKKPINILLILTLIISLSFYVSASKLNNDLIEINSDTFMNLDEDGEMLKKNKSENTKGLSNSSVIIDALKMTNTYGLIIGSVKYDNGEGNKFNITGELKNTGRENDTLVVSDFTDTLNNFEVVYCALSNDVSKINLFDKDRYSDYKEDINSLLTLILLEKGTNRLTILEWYNPTFDVDRIIKNQNKLLKT